MDDLVENYELRIALESLAAEKAALNATRDDIIELQELLDEMHRPPPGIATDDEDYYIRLNARFHARIYEIAHRPRLFALIESLRDQAAIYIRIYTHTSSSAEATEAQHTEIVEAIRRRAPKRAAKAVRDHGEVQSRLPPHADRPAAAPPASGLADRLVAEARRCHQARRSM